ncbi:MAG: aminomethyl-transferring glycine dehydrogenase subunit GcvPB [Deltaproteobacteria bacterium]|jgi:glycine dehydrogenase subunit 2|nr:aminomethyl-transferring glycine dehydrogenase subunit GcvPB [Deltaproteobacteria bacterium]
MKTIFAQSSSGRKGVIPAKPERTAEDMLPKYLLRRTPPRMPQVSELDVVRHFTALSRKNYNIDNNFYPLGSCTMKYNPKFMEYAASLPGFALMHPLLAQQPGGESMTQGSLEVIHETERLLAEVTGMAAFSLQPMAGAQGELTGALLIAAYHKHKGNKKSKIICPDSAHGTNPATAALAGYEVINIASKDGVLDPQILGNALDDSVAALMMTCPNTLGLFEKHLPELVEKLRASDALLYYDGANFNAIMGRMRVGDVGFDVVHLNLHKTMGTPHGGGGPGSGPVGVSERLVPFLPGPCVYKKTDGSFALQDNLPLSIGRVTPFYGHFGVFIKALAYMLRLGGHGLARASDFAVLNANYMRKRLERVLEIPYNEICMHEFVASASAYETHGVKALDIAKALLERGYHAPTVYFPLIIKECLMFEPTETENKATLDKFCDDLIEILEQAEKNPENLRAAPVNLPVRRLDETKAAREMVLVDEV